MCGRYSLESADSILGQLGLAGALPDWQAAYNLAPGQDIPCVIERHDRGRELAFLRWGLVPHWAKDPKVGYKMINARRETVADKPAFRDSLSRRRCLVPATGFYEWKRDGNRKLPYNLQHQDGSAFAMAGVWASWQDAEGDLLRSVAIITAPANSLVAPIHDRMPVIIAPADYQRWLSAELRESDAVADILASPDYSGFESYEVSTLVNSVKNDGQELIARGPVQQRLF